MKAKKTLEKVKSKANVIMNDEEISEHSKTKALKQLYKNQIHKVKPQSVYLVRKKFQKGKSKIGPKSKGSTNYKVVDPRMKKDLKNMKSKSKRKK